MHMVDKLFVHFILGRRSFENMKIYESNADIDPCHEYLSSLDL